MALPRPHSRPARPRRRRHHQAQAPRDAGLPVPPLPRLAPHLTETPPLTLPGRPTGRACKSRFGNGLGGSSCVAKGCSECPERVLRVSRKGDQSTGIVRPAASLSPSRRGDMLIALNLPRLNLPLGAASRRRAAQPTAGRSTEGGRARAGRERERAGAAAATVEQIRAVVYRYRRARHVHANRSHVRRVRYAVTHRGDRPRPTARCTRSEPGLLVSDRARELRKRPSGDSRGASSCNGRLG